MPERQSPPGGNQGGQEIGAATTLSRPILPDPSFDTAHADEYLRQIFGSAPGRISLSYTTAKGGMVSQHFDMVLHAAAKAREWDRLHRPQGIYVRCTTLVASEAMTGRRGGESDSLALPFLWADLDFGAVGHKPANGALPLPPTADDALESSMACPPRQYSCTPAAGYIRSGSSISLS